MQSLTALSQKLPVLDTIEDNESKISDALATILFRLRQLEPYTVTGFTFMLQGLENDIKAYTAILQQYQQPITEKIDFLIDIGKLNGGWDEDIALHLEEILDDIIYFSNQVNSILS